MNDPNAQTPDAPLRSEQARLTLEILASALDAQAPPPPPPADPDLDSDARFVPPTATPPTPDDARASD